MLSGHPDDPLLGAIPVGDDELEAGRARRAGRDSEHLAAKRVLADGASFESSLAELLDTVFEADLAVVAECRGREEGDRRLFRVRGDQGVAVGTLPTEQRFLSAFDRPQLVELVLSFLGLRAWATPASTQGWRVSPAEGDGQGETVVDFLQELGTYAYVHFAATGSDARRLAWIDSGGGSLCHSSARSSSGRGDGRSVSVIELRPVVGGSLIDAVVDAVIDTGGSSWTG